MAKLPLGRFPGYAKEDYLADPGYGSGGIRSLAESPAALHMERLLPRDSTEEMDFGTAFHMRLLEPRLYERHVVELEREVSFATKEGKALRASVARDRGLEEQELLFLKPRQVATLRVMLSGREAIEEAMGLDPFAEPGECECAYFWEDRGGVRGKALVDKEVTELHWLLDVKTTRRSLDDRSLLRYAAEIGWAVQAAWYVRGVSRIRADWEDASFAFAVFQTVPPFSVRFMPVPPETLRAAGRLVERALDHHGELLEAKAAGKRPRDAVSGVLELRYPEWFLEAQGLA